MPMPQEYQRAKIIYDKILIDIADEVNLATRNQTYTLMQSVLFVFRRRLTAERILQFCALLPPLPRAIFVKGWRADEFTLTYGDRASLTEEAKDLRRDHNFSDENTIKVVTKILRQHMDNEKLSAFLDTLPKDAHDFWFGE